MRVHVRLRPVPAGLSKAQATKTIFGIRGRAVGQHNQYGKPTLYRLHKVYDEKADNAAVFEGSMFESFRALISGVNSAVIVTGAHGSGKTHTTSGHGEPGAQQSHQAKGLLTFLCEKVLRTMKAERDNGNLERFELCLSVVQVCSQRGTEVFDLLDRNNRLVAVRSASPSQNRRNGSPEARSANGATKFALEARALHPVTSIQDIYRLLNCARQSQAQRDGHVVATLHLTQIGNPATADVEPAPAEVPQLEELVRRHRAGRPIPPFGERNRRQAPPPTVTAQLSLVDVSASPDKDIMATRADLKRVVKTIASNGRGSFRDSILTKILQNCLSSPAGITVLVTASPTHANSTATRHHLRFGCELAGWQLTTAHERYQDEKISRFLREEAINRQAPVGPVA